VPDGRLAIDYLAGTGAYTDCRQHPLPCLLLLDLNLPVKSGLACGWSGFTHVHGRQLHVICTYDPVRCWLKKCVTVSGIFQAIPYFAALNSR
jgi:hypothetical protein